MKNPKKQINDMFWINIGSDKIKNLRQNLITDQLYRELQIKMWREVAITLEFELEWKVKDALYKS